MEREEGWGEVFSLTTGRYADREHYFVDGHSLCGRYMRFTNSDLIEKSHNKCKSCSAKLEKRNDGLSKR